MSTYKAPGVYTQEISAFPNSVVQVPTAIPAFVGYTEFARKGATDLTGVPTRISSLTELEAYFGGGPNTQFDVSDDIANPAFAATAGTQFLLYRSMRLFFENGGGPCWIVSIGGYGASDTPVAKKAAAFTGDVLKALTEIAEVTLLIAPDAVLLPIDGWSEVMNAYLQHCAETQNRVVITDVYDGDKARTGGDNDVISGPKSGLRTLIANDRPSYGAAYYPWLNTTIVAANEVTFLNLSDAAHSKVADHVAADLQATIPKGMKDKEKAELRDQHSILLAALRMDDKKAAKLAEQDRKAHLANHTKLMTASRAYKRVMTGLLTAINILPPAAGMAGVYARTDSQIGVFKAPANTSIASVHSPIVAISNEEQEDLNAPLDGKAVNAIRAFTGRGVLVWGARTLDGNSEDWRYINVRRTMMMLEQSIKLAAEAYVFAPNDASTWAAVKTMIENFLNNAWKMGVLAGAKPEDAYSVSVGLGSTMTAHDILDGVMRVTAHVAITHPAEFYVITFEQKMATS